MLQVDLYSNSVLINLFANKINWDSKFTVHNTIFTIFWWTPLVCQARARTMLHMPWIATVLSSLLMPLVFVLIVGSGLLVIFKRANTILSVVCCFLVSLNVFSHSLSMYLVCHLVSIVIWPTLPSQNYAEWPLHQSLLRVSSIGSGKFD